ncbi:RHS repeat protein [Tumebacillus sp. ITR2]|uniref:RHS repeat protein n=1 Tax=Tumebacillus amylolyticus TaxID=2801339 RepID=A0ABS1JBG3_9BACL|nr:RHS repeat protein [Tumebacillus amylolyticus]MBL0387379.1 RHS repeat protein [Tumebacillus amylolyticus]
MKRNKKLASVVTAALIVSTVYSPVAGAAQSQDIAMQTALSPKDQVSKEFGIPADAVQEALYQGFSIVDVRKAAEISKKHSAPLLDILKESHPTVTSGAVATTTQPQSITSTVVSSQDLAAAKTRASTAYATGTTSTSPDITARFDQAPYVVSDGKGTVSPPTGSSILSNGDITLAGRNGLNFVLTRSYDSNSAQLYKPDFDSSVAGTQNYEDKLFKVGTGWMWSVPSIENQNGYTTLHLGNGASYAIDSSTYKPKGYAWSDITVQPGYYTEIGNVYGYCYQSTRDNVKYFFNSSGQLLLMKDMIGNTINFTWSSVTLRGATSSMLTKVKTSAGNTLDVTYSDLQYTLTTSNTSSQSRQTVKYNFDKNTYDILSKSTDTTTKTVTYYTLKEVVDPAGRSTKYYYSLNHAWTAKSSDLTIMSEDPYVMLSNIDYPTMARTSYTYETAIAHVSTQGTNDAYKVTDVYTSVPNDATTKYNHYQFTYDGDMYHVRTADKIYTRTITDDLGNKTDLTFAVDTEPKYNLPFNKLTTQAVKQGNYTTTTENKYTDSRKLPVPDSVVKTVTDNTNPTNSVSSTVTSTYDNWGNVLTSIDSEGANTLNKFDSTKHWPTETKTYLSGTPNTAGSRFKLVTFNHTSPSGTVSPLIYSTEVFDGTDTGSTTSTTQSLRKTSYTYDSFGNVVKQDVSNAGKINSTSYTYDSQSLFMATKNQLNSSGAITNTVKYNYDDLLGQPLTITDGKNNVTTFIYDALGRVTKTLLPNGSSTSLAYDDVNNTITKTETDEGTKSVLLVSSNKFDALGNKIQAVLDGKVQQKYYYDAYGRNTRVEDSLGNAVEYAYDAVGRKTLSTIGKTSDFEGYKTTTTYDDVARTELTVNPDGNTTKTTYDVMGRVASTMTGDQKLLEKDTYDFAGNVLTKTNPNSQVTNYTYDALNHLLSVQDANGGKTQYSYDMNGNVTSVTNPDTTKESSTYDESGKLLTFTDAVGKVEQYTYDSNGNLAKKVDRNGNTLLFTYDTMNLLTMKTATLPGASGVTDTISYEYDLLGHKTKMTDSTGPTSYKYQKDGSLTLVTLPDGKSFSYSYNDNGSRSKMTDPTGKDTYYTYNNLNQLTSVTLDSPTNQPEASYTYTPGGKPNTITQGNNMVTQYNYNTMGRVDTINQNNGAANVNAFSYGYDMIGNVTSTGQNGVAKTYSFDKVNRLSGTSDYNESYQYDNRGNRMTLASDRDLGANVQNRSYQYDVWGRLAKVLDGSGSVLVSYKYNGNDMLYERTELGKTTRYYYDNQNLVAEANVVSGTVVFTARYVRGAGLLTRIDVSTTSKSYYSTDLQGNVVDLRDSSGNLLNHYSYDAWGLPTQSTGDVKNPLQYSSEFWDNTAGLQFLRARWYDPAQGRFISEDSEHGALTNPQTLNRYVYALNNPLVASDSSGHWCESKDHLWAHYGGCVGEGSTYSSDAGHTDKDLRNGQPSQIIIQLEGINTGGVNTLDPLGAKFADQYKAAVFNFNVFEGDIGDGIAAVAKMKANIDSGKADYVATQIEYIHQQFPNVPLYIIAHSGGAEVAVVATDQLVSQGKHYVTGIATIGGANSSNAKNTNTYNIMGIEPGSDGEAGYKDPVPHLFQLGITNEIITLQNGEGFLGVHTHYCDPENINIVYSAMLRGLGLTSPDDMW